MKSLLIILDMITQNKLTNIRERKKLQEKKLPSKETEDGADPG
jgi:hypothetical protein